MIEPALAGLAAARAATLDLLAPLSQAQLEFSPAPGRWSIGETADHVLLAESLYRDEIARLIDLARAGRRPYLKRSFSDVDVAPLHLPTPLLSLLEAPIALAGRFVPDALRSLVTEFPVVPTRHPARASPRPGRGRAELCEALARGLSETSALLAGNRDLDFAAMISEHPLMGASTVPAIVHFLALHERRHQGQMDRVRRDPGFPRT